MLQLFRGITLLILAASCGNETMLRNGSEPAASAEVDSDRASADAISDQDFVQGNASRDLLPTPAPEVPGLWETASFSLNIATEQISPAVTVALVIDNSRSMASSMATLVSGLRQLLRTSVLSYPNLNFVVTTTTLNLGQDNEYYESVDGTLIRRSPAPDVGTMRVISKVIDPESRQFSVTAAMSEIQVQEVFDSIVSHVENLGTNGSPDERGLCKLLHMRKVWSVPGQPFGAFFLTNEDEIPSSSQSSWIDQCDLDYQDIPYTSPSVTYQAPCNPASETCETTLHRTYSVNVIYSRLSFDRLVVTNNDGDITTSRVPTDHYVQNCGSTPELCVLNGSGCNAAQENLLRTQYRDFDRCRAVSEYRPVSTYRNETAGLCENTLSLNGLDYANYPAYLSSQGLIVDASSCKEEVVTTHLKPMTYKYQQSGLPSKVRVLPPVGENQNGHSLARRIANYFNDRTNNQFFFVAGIRQAELDQAEDCGLSPNFSYGAHYQTLVEELGLRGSMFSLCQPSYESALQQLASFIDTLVTDFIYVVEHPVDQAAIESVKVVDSSGTVLVIEPDLISFSGKSVSLDPSLAQALPPGSKIEGVLKFKKE